MKSTRRAKLEGRAGQCHLFSPRKTRLQAGDKAENCLVNARWPIALLSGNVVFSQAFSYWPGF